MVRKRCCCEKSYWLTDANFRAGNQAFDSETRITAETHMRKSKARWDVRFALIACASFIRLSRLSHRFANKSCFDAGSGHFRSLGTGCATCLEPRWVDSAGKPLAKLPLTPWGEEQFKASRATHGANMVPSATSTEPIAKCLPPGVPAIYMFIFPMEIMQIPGRVVMFFEYGNYFRQIFTDGRKHQN